MEDIDSLWHEAWRCRRLAWTLPEQAALLGLAAELEARLAAAHAAAAPGVT